VDFERAVAEPVDCAVVTTDHACFDYDRLAKLPLVVDTRNALVGRSGGSIFKL
jgi:hypothetical protein